jgi:hypothetical protein
MGGKSPLLFLLLVLLLRWWAELSPDSCCSTSLPTPLDCSALW